MNRYATPRMGKHEKLSKFEFVRDCPKTKNEYELSTSVHEHIYCLRVNEECQLWYYEENRGKFDYILDNTNPKFEYDELACQLSLIRDWGEMMGITP